MARNRHAQTAELLTPSSYKNVLIENVALRGRDGKGVAKRNERERERERERGGGEARGMINVRGQQLNGERGRPQGRLMAVGGTGVIYRTRCGIPTPARGVRIRGGPGQLRMLQMLTK